MNKLSPNVVTVNSYINSGGVAIDENWPSATSTRHHQNLHHHRSLPGRSMFQTVTVPTAEGVQTRLYPVMTTRSHNISYQPMKFLVSYEKLFILDNF